MALLLTAFLMFLQSAAVVPALEKRSANVDGIVIRVGSGESVAGAYVALWAVEADPSKVSPPKWGFTDSAGRFHFDGLKAGRYQLAASADGHAPQGYGEGKGFFPGAPFDLDEDQKKRVTIRLKPAGSIAGRLRTETGRPIAGIEVRLFHLEYSETAARWPKSFDQTMSNDLGEYRFHDLIPGHYMVLAGNGPSGQRRGNLIMEDSPVLFFPGTAEIEKAGIIVVDPGGEIRNIDLTLTELRHTIRLRVSDPQARPPTPLELASFEVRLYYDRLDGDKDLTLTPTAPPEPVWYDATDRSYVVAGLPPGKYLIAAPGIFRDIGLLASDLTLDLAVSEEASAAAPPEDPGAKPSPVRQAMRIRGRIRVDGKLPDGVALSQLNIRAGAESIEPSNNGEFSVELDPVEFSVTMPDLPPGLYLKRAELGGRDALANIMSFDPAAELEVEISSRGGYVAGIVRDSLDRLAPGADVVLIPEKADIHVEPLPGNGVSFVPRVLNTLALFKTAITDDQGQFSFAGIAPGAYRLYALEALEPFSYFDPEVLQQIESKGQPLRVTVASRETVALRLMLSGAGR